MQLLEHLGARRRKEAKKLRAIVTKSGSTLRKHLKRTSADLRRVLCERTEDPCDPKAASAVAAARALTLESELTAPARLERENLHPYRLKVKELHNVLRLAENANAGWS